MQETWDGRQETGGKMQEAGGKMQETWDIRQEAGDKHCHQEPEVMLWADWHTPFTIHEVVLVTWWQERDRQLKRVFSSSSSVAVVTEENNVYSEGLHPFDDARWIWLWVSACSFLLTQRLRIVCSLKPHIYMSWYKDLNQLILHRQPV